MGADPPFQYIVSNPSLESLDSLIYMLAPFKDAMVAVYLTIIVTTDPGVYLFAFVYTPLINAMGAG